ncbi:helix-turn-helix domain-containing protein [Roseomonas sp. CCTCC AB2023176]|uniref:helix-turn-helix domain-containing protein n=1 Tax=Roseomonas sp. CCTCC AB2023176 TaxID=3342640 RepID=UPI0035D8FB18
MTAAAHAFGGEWLLPGREVIAWRIWDRFAAGVYERGAGEGVWRGGQHRLVYPLNPRPPILLQVDGGPIEQLPYAEDEILGFYPAGAAVRTQGDSSRYAQLCWDPNLYGSIAPDLPAPPSLEPVICDDPLVGQIMRTLVAEIGAGTLDRLLAESLVAALAMRMAHRTAAKAPATPDLDQPRLRRVLDYIEANLGADLSLAELAEVACLSPCHLSRSFTRALGIGPRRYAQRRRVEHAKDLLRGADPIATIAADLGFADQSHFTNVFRKETGMTPGRFRRGAAG